MTIKYLDSKRISTSSAEYKVHSFTSDGTFAVTGSGDVEYLVIAGGGSGGVHYGGGGGAGGYRTNVVGETSGGGASAEASYTVTAQNYSVTVGAGAAGSTISGGSGGATSNGGDSSIIPTSGTSIISAGGGSGYGQGNGAGTAGGSGGGSRTSAYAGGAGTSGQGFAGGAGGSGASYPCGGGGGSGSVGANGSGGNGGAGTSSSITGTAVIRAGGGGGADDGSVGTGSAGGGNGAVSTGSSNGTANSGSGGGSSQTPAGAGGSGIVIIRYLTSSGITATGGTITTISVAETKPTNVQDNSILVEKDTANRFWYDGSVWTQELPVTSGLKLWLDASDSTTITKDGSNLVSAWNDKSGQLNHVAQATATNQPLWVDAVHNGRPTIRFDGVDNFMKRATWVNGELSQPNTIFIVCTYPTAVNGVAFDSGTAGKRALFLRDGGTNYGYYAGISVTGSVAVNATFSQYVILYNGTNSEMRRNKVNQQIGMNFGTEAMNGMVLASLDTGAGQYGNMDISEILIYNADVSDTDRDLIEDYLATKWGL